MKELKIVPIPGYEEYYGITNCGIIFSYNYRATGRISEIAQSSLRDRKRKNDTMYRRAKLFHINQTSPVAVHRLVALTFIPNPNNYPQVNHIDGDKANNNVSNLEWCTNKQNVQHAEETGLASHVAGDSHGMHILKEWQVIDIIRELSSESYRGQASRIAYRYGVSMHCIHDIKKKKSWNCVWAKIESGEVVL